MIRLRQDVNVLGLLKAAGYSSTRIRKEALLGQSTLQKLRTNVLPSWHELDVICGLLHMQPGDMVERVPDGGFKYSERGSRVHDYAMGKGVAAIRDAMVSEDGAIDEAARLYSGVIYAPLSIDTITEAVDMPVEQRCMLGKIISRCASDDVEDDEAED